MHRMLISQFSPQKSARMHWEDNFQICQEVPCIPSVAYAAKEVQVKRKHWSYWENTSISWHSILHALSVLETYHLLRWNPRTTQVAAWRSMNPNIKSWGDGSLANDLGIGPLMLVSFVKISSVTNPESYRRAEPGPFFHHRNTDGGWGHNSRVVRHLYLEVPGLCRWEPTTTSASPFSECSQAVDARCLSFFQ